MDVPDSVELTIVVFAPATGAAPLPLPNVGALGDVARNNMYPVVVAPVPGNVAAFQERLILLEEVAIADKPEAWAVGGLDKVRKVISLPYTVPISLVTYARV